MTQSSWHPTMRLAELLGVMASAGDAGMGLPDEAGIRGAVLAVGLAEEVGAPDAERADAFWVSLLRFAGCTAETHLNAAVMGDEVAVHGDMYAIDWGDPREMLPFLVRLIGRERQGAGSILFCLFR